MIPNAFCPFCGSNLPPSSQFCNRCGKSQARQPQQMGGMMEMGKSPNVPSIDPSPYYDGNQRNYDHVKSVPVAPVAPPQINRPPNYSNASVTSTTPDFVGMGEPEVPKVGINDVDTSFDVHHVEHDAEQGIYRSEKEKKGFICSYSFSYYPVWFILLIVWVLNCVITTGIWGVVWYFATAQPMFSNIDKFKVLSFDSDPGLFAFGGSPNGIICAGGAPRCIFSLGPVNLSMFSIGFFNITLVGFGWIGLGVLGIFGQIAVGAGVSIGQLATGTFVPLAQVGIGGFALYCQMAGAPLMPFFQEKGKEKPFRACGMN